MTDIERINNILGTNLKTDNLDILQKIELSGRKYKLSEDFIERYNEKYLDWFTLSKCQKLSRNLLRKYKEIIAWNEFCRYQNITEDIIEEFKDYIDWGIISAYQTLSENFIEKYKDRVDWYYISSYQALSEEFIKKHIDKIDWKGISYKQKLSEEFIKRYWENLNHYFICAYQNLSEEFIYVHEDSIDWDGISYNKYLPEKIIIKYKNKNLNWEIILERRILSKKSITELKDKLDPETVLSSQIYIDHLLQNDKDNNTNELYDLYQQTKDRGWFIGYIIRKSFCNEWMNEEFSIQINEKILLTPLLNIYKVKVYWKDISHKSYCSNYKIIRKIKII